MHAYLILAHNDPAQLARLVQALDDPRNAIFIHIDKKSDIASFQSIHAIHSRLEFIENRIDVRWGDPSQIYAEYELFKQARNCSHFDYYHLLSGADFPLRSQDYIHNRLDADNKLEYISFENKSSNDSDVFGSLKSIEFAGGKYLITRELYIKCILYNPFLPYIACKNKIIRFFANQMRRGLLAVQMATGIKRHYSLGQLKKGSNWCSLTEEAVNLILSKEELIKKEFRMTHCSDEVYKQYIIWNSTLRDWISPDGNLRYIDFGRGNGKNPYVFQSDDYETLISSDMLFARKFTTAKSKDLVEKLMNHIMHPKFTDSE